MKKKVKVKKKALIIIPVIILLITGIIFGNKLLIKNKKNSYYHPYGITIKDTSLYDNNKQVVGSISKDIGLELEKTSTDYFKIKNTSYYIYYSDIKEGKNKSLEKNYIPFNNNIKTTNKVSLLQDNQEKITLDKGINIPIEYQDENNYYVSFSNQLFTIVKNENLEIIEHNNTNEEIANHVSILNYDTIKETCDSVICTTIDNFKTHVNALKENGYYTIDEITFNNYLKNYIHLKKGAIYIVSNTPKEEIPNISELNINVEKNNPLTIKTTNKPTTPSSNIVRLDSYQIKNYSLTENIIKMANGEEVIETSPNINDNQSVPVLNYHFFYSDDESCNETICLNINKFKEHLQYLKDNGFKALTMEEFRKWMYGEIEIPNKSVLITIDDGAMGTGKHNGNKLIPALEEYQMNATLFLITGWWKIENYESSYLDIQSHTYDMHQYGTCGTGQITCATYDEALADLRLSLDIVKNNDSFCFPFYSYNDTSLKAVKDAGFKLAFVGGNRQAKRKDNKFLVPRYPIHSNITMSTFKNMVN